MFCRSLFKFSIKVSENLLSDGKLAQSALVNISYNKQRWLLFNSVFLDYNEVYSSKVSNRFLIDSSYFRFLRLFFGLRNCRRWSRISSIKLVSLKSFCFFWYFRLDVLLYLVGFFKNIYQASFFISSGFVMVNGKRCTYGNFLLGKGDLVRVFDYNRLLFNKVGETFFYTQYNQVCVQRDIFYGDLVEVSYTLGCFVVVGGFSSVYSEGFKSGGFFSVL